ncbi:hypothetical protein [Chelativorans sp. AA-79]|uniref:hypothetical protein n=1 Tax=Chelativorans sp. AA-79 TaxID=3028735 RepID=UPI0023F80D12|nr:hypothetical protein [Chelativorans sp. AA-79]WEX07827.1 hypothetical protein PVE73_17220 [Chelativorans sp. AA-79]
MPEEDRVKPTEAQLKARRNRSIAIALALAAFVIIVYLGSILKLGPGIFDRGM